MAQQIARDRDYSYGRQTGRYKLLQPFANYATPDLLTVGRERKYWVTEKGYTPSLSNLTSYTNYCLQSDAINQTPWSRPWSDTFADAGVAGPDGPGTASAMTEATGNSPHGFTQVLACAAGPLALAIGIKAGLRTFFNLSISNATDGNVSNCTFNLTTLAVQGLGGTTGFGGRVVPMGNGYFMCVVFGTATVANSSITCLASPDGSTFTYVGSTANVAASFFRVTVAPLLSFVGPPIQTTTATRTILCPDVDSVVNAGDGTDLDPLAYQAVESIPAGMQTGLLSYTKSYYRVPNQKIIPASFLFTAPNYGAVALPQVQTPQASVLGLYGVQVGNAVGSVLSNGYFDVAYPVGAAVMPTNGAGAASNPTVNQITVAGNNFVAGDVLLMRYPITGFNFWSLSVTSVSGSTVNVIGVPCAAQEGLFPINTNNYVRRRIKDVPDYGQVIGLTARVVENYYLPGVTPGISTYTDIPSVNPFNIGDYLAAYAGNLTWFNVQADPLAVWMGAIIVQRSTQAMLPGTSPHGYAFISASGNWTVPAGVYNLRRVLLWGAGGGGGYGPVGAAFGGGGGGEGGKYVYYENFPVTPGQVIAIVIGVGGLGGTVGSPTGSVGGSSSFGGNTVLGGNGGLPGQAAHVGGVGGGTGAFWAGGLGGNGSTTFGGGGGASPDQAGFPATSTNSGFGANGTTAGGGGGADATHPAQVGGIGVLGNGPGGGNAASTGGTGPANSGSGGGGGGGNGGNGGPGSNGGCIITW